LREACPESVGPLTVDNISEMIMISAALKHNGTTSHGGHRPRRSSAAGPGGPAGDVLEATVLHADQPKSGQAAKPGLFISAVVDHHFAEKTMDIPCPFRAPSGADDP
jgi:hypothetical protein